MLNTTRRRRTVTAVAGVQASVSVLPIMATTIPVTATPTWVTATLTISVTAMLPDMPLMAAPAVPPRTATGTLPGMVMPHRASESASALVAGAVTTGVVTTGADVS